MAATVTGLDKVVQSLRDLSKRHKPITELAVGFSAHYAMRVHEDLAMAHPRGGQAKFLEQPLRENQLRVAEMIREDVAKGMTSAQAMEKAGHYILVLAKQLVPVDTGFLRDSGYVAVRGA